METASRFARPAKKEGSSGQLVAIRGIPATSHASDTGFTISGVDVVSSEWMCRLLTSSLASWLARRVRLAVDIKNRGAVRFPIHDQSARERLPHNAQRVRIRSTEQSQWPRPQVDEIDPDFLGSGQPIARLRGSRSGVPQHQRRARQRPPMRILRRDGNTGAPFAFAISGRFFMAYSPLRRIDCARRAHRATTAATADTLPGAKRAMLQCHVARPRAGAKQPSGRPSTRPETRDPRQPLAAYPSRMQPGACPVERLTSLTRRPPAPNRAQPDGAMTGSGSPREED